MKIRVQLNDGRDEQVVEAEGQITINVNTTTAALTLRSEREARTIAAFASGVWLTATEITDED